MDAQAALLRLSKRHFLAECLGHLAFAPGQRVKTSEDKEFIAVVLQHPSSGLWDSCLGPVARLRPGISAGWRILWKWT
jgi:hypothetical protein